VSLSALLFTEYRRKVLALLLLHPEQQYHLREIARLTGTASGTLSRELSRMTAAGLLLRHAVGNQVHYRANVACPIFHELASILRKTSGLVDVLAEGLLPLSGRIELAFVFGSMASGKSTSDSDIDLLVVGEVGFGELVSQLYPLQETLGREINPQLFLPEEWRERIREQGAFIRDVLAKPKLFLIGDEQDLPTEGGQG